MEHGKNVDNKVVVLNARGRKQKKTVDVTKTFMRNCDCKQSEKYTYKEKVNKKEIVNNRWNIKNETKHKLMFK